MTCKDADGRSITYVWDYKQDVPVDEKEMKMGSERWKESEKARWTQKP